MNGNNRLVVHGMIVKTVFEPDVSANRGIVNVLEAVVPLGNGAPEVNANAPELLFGAKLRPTVAGPGAGRLLATLAVYAYHTTKSKFSSVAALVAVTSQVALAVPLLLTSWA
jgi:hypothetical protein